VTLDLAAALVALGHRPLIVDREKGRAAIALGLKPRYELSHVLSGDKTLVEVLLTARNGVAVLPAMRGLERAGERGSWKRTLSEVLREAPRSFTVWLINGAAGPVAAAVGRADLIDALTYGEASDTYSGNPRACAAVCATFDVFKRERVVQNCRKMATVMQRGLHALEDGERRRSGHRW
jgi:hypothetical protein